MSKRIPEYTNKELSCEICGRLIGGNTGYSKYHIWNMIICKTCYDLKKYEKVI